MNYSDFLVLRVLALYQSESPYLSLEEDALNSPKGSHQIGRPFCSGLFSWPKGLRKLGFCYLRSISLRVCSTHFQIKIEFD